MYGVLLCLLAFALVFVAARRSLVAGLVMLMAVGYVYGIVRANVNEAMSHFSFDAGVAALYLVHLPRLWRRGQAPEVARIRSWMLLLLGWPLLLVFIPVQDPLIQVVGLRGSTFLVPFIVVGASLRGEELRQLGVAFAMLNIAAFGVACAEFVMGIEAFFPRNAVTELIYRSRDIVGYSAHRIPSTFTSAHAFAGTVMGTVPFLLGTWSDSGAMRRWRPLLVASLVVTAISIFMAGARLPVVGLFGLVMLATLSGRMKLTARIGVLMAGAVVAFVVASSDRLQRFRSLEDTEAVVARVQGSVNRSFVDFALDYPLGNGLGGGGTSVPFFLQDRLRDPVLIENEYGRIMLEQGIAGLAIWVCFIAWMLLRAARNRGAELTLGHRLALGLMVFSFGTAAIGTGTLTSIPGTVIIMLCCGWACGVTSRSAVPRAQVVGSTPVGATVGYG